MNNCEETNILKLAQWLTGGAIAFPSVMWLWQWWRERRHPAAPHVREVAYALDMVDAPYRVDGLTLAISKHRNGGPPWQTFPPDISRETIERLYDVHIRGGKLPTEKEMLGRGVTRTNLRAIRDYLYATGRAVYLRNGNNAPWKLNQQGENDLTFWTLRLNGKIPLEYVRQKPNVIRRHDG